MQFTNYLLSRAYPDFIILKNIYCFVLYRYNQIPSLHSHFFFLFYSMWKPTLSESWLSVVTVEYCWHFLVELNILVVSLISLFAFKLLSISKSIILSLSKSLCVAQIRNHVFLIVCTMSIFGHDYRVSCSRS